VVGAFAPSFGFLLAGRIVQALGTGLLIPIGMNITLEVAPREKLGTYLGIMGAMTTLGPSSSVILAGALLSVGDWRLLLWVFAGLATLCLLAGAVWLGNIARLTRPRLDAASVALIGVGLTGLLYGVSTVFTGDLLVAGLAAAAGVISTTLFVRRQNRLAQPLIDLRPLRVGRFTQGVAINMLALVVIFALNIIIPMFMQSARGVPSLDAALVLFPAIALSCVLSPIAGRICDRRGAATLLRTGFVLIACFTAALAVLIDTVPLPVLALLYMPVIGGSALIIGPVQSYALSHLDRDLYPHGVTIMSTGFQVAGCIGSSLLTGVYAGVIAWQSALGNEPTAAPSGFLAAGLVTAAFAVAGLAFALRVPRKAPTPQAATSDASNPDPVSSR
jgi:DHA2 family lincomycin resistance protein-like MFS transporter